MSKDQKIVDFQIINNSLELRFYGEIDNCKVLDVEKEIEKEVLKSATNEVEINLNDVSFIDSSGVGLIINIYKQVKAFNGVLKIKNARDYVLKILNMSGIDKFIDFSD